MIDLDAIRQRNEARKADLAAVIQPERMWQRVADDIDVLLAEVEVLREDNQRYADFLAFIPTGTFTIERLPSGMLAFIPIEK